MAQDDKERQSALQKLLELQRQDFAEAWWENVILMMVLRPSILELLFLFQLTSGGQKMKLGNTSSIWLLCS